jgi:hypothetical protein
MLAGAHRRAEVRRLSEDAAAEEEKHGNGALEAPARDPAHLLSSAGGQDEARVEIPGRVVRDLDNSARPAMAAAGFDRLGRVAGGRDDDGERPGRRRRGSAGRGVLDDGIDPATSQECSRRERGEARAAHADEDHPLRVERPPVERGVKVGVRLEERRQRGRLGEDVLAETRTLIVHASRSRIASRATKSHVGRKAAA